MALTTATSEGGFVRSVMPGDQTPHDGGEFVRVAHPATTVAELLESHRAEVVRFSAERKIDAVPATHAEFVELDRRHTRQSLDAMDNTATAVMGALFFAVPFGLAFVALWAVTPLGWHRCLASSITLGGVGHLALTHYFLPVLMGAAEESDAPAESATPVE